MGYEYKIVTKLTDKQATEIQELLAKSMYFDKKYEFGGKVFWDFRHPENHYKMPTTSLHFERDGIYICQYGTSFLWTGLDGLKDYLENQKVEFEVVDYQD